MVPNHQSTTTKDQLQFTRDVSRTRLTTTISFTARVSTINMTKSMTGPHTKQ